MFERRKVLAALLALVFTAAGLWSVPSWSAATVDRAVCSTADKAGGDPSNCSGTELIDSATQEVAKLYQGNILVVQSVGGTANAITGSTTPAATALVDGEMRQIKPGSNNTSAVTYNDNGLGAKQVVSAAGAALSAGDLQSTTVYILRYYAANDQWMVLTNLGTGTASASNAYVTIGNTGSLSAERALTAGTCVSVTDGGANSTATVAVASCSSANLRGAVTDETGSGSAVFASSPSLTTPTIGSGGANFSGSTSGTTNLTASATASGTLTLPAATDTLVGKATTDTLTNKSISLGSNTLTTTSVQLATALSDETGSGSAVFATSPTFAGTVTTAASTTSAAPLNIPPGTAPTSPQNGDVWTETSNIKVKFAGGTATLANVSGTQTLTNKTINLSSNTLSATSEQMRTALSDEVGSGALMFGLSPSMSDDLSCTGSQVVRRNAADNSFECATVAGTGDMIAANNLSDLTNAATARANLGIAVKTKTRVFTVGGSYQPSAGTKSIIGYITGSGGSGGSINTAATAAAGPYFSTGGSGAGTVIFSMDVSDTDVYQIGIGAAPPTTLATTAAASGSPSTFGKIVSGAVQSIVVAPGGAGGQSSLNTGIYNPTNPAAISAPALPAGGAYTAINGGQGGVGVPMWSSATVFLVTTSAGGDSYWGSGPAASVSRNNSTAMNGADATIYGAGGSGAGLAKVNTTVARTATGGRGAQGICIIIEVIN
jgi:hypothetical protein